MILINIARIKPDSTALEFNVETDSNYTFKNLYKDYFLRYIEISNLIID